MALQTLPSAASNYAAAQRLEQQTAISAVLRQWRRMTDDFDGSWARVAPVISAILTEAQRRVIDGADAYIPSVLAETDQPDQPLAPPNTGALAGMTGAGQPLRDALALAPIRAKQAVAEGATPWQALQTAGQWVSSASGLLLSDTGRSAEGLNMYTRSGGGGFVRMLTPPSCGRCVVLAGKWFRYNEGFSRHPPTCDCRHIPASESVAGDLTVDPQAYFESLTDEEQAKVAGSEANADAIRSGANVGQVINAYRKTSGMQFAQVSPIKLDRRGNRFTTEGTTRRGIAGQQQAGLRRNGTSQLRLMPESIARIAKTEDDRLRLLKLYGWILDDEAINRGRNLLVAQRRDERNLRARARRAERRT